MADVPLPLLASLLFTLIGPLPLIPAFASATAAADKALRLRIALMAFGTSVVALSLAVFAGASAMAKAGTSPAALILAGGVILTLTALRSIFTFGTAPPNPAPSAPTIGLGLTPIAIPGIVTPVGVAVIIIFVSYFPDFDDKIVILGVTLAILFANLLAMMFAHTIMRVIGAAPLLVLGAVFGVLQAAMGVEMILSGLRRAAVAPL